MGNQSENETEKTLESTDEGLDEQELDEVSGGDESPKETITHHV